MADPARELLILGILRRGSLSAYDVDRAVHGHAPLYRPLKSGNVYYALERLATNGIVVRRAAKTRRGPSATKLVYRLAPSGEAYFRALLRTALTDVQGNDATLEVAYILLGQLPRAEARALLEERREGLVAYERRLTRLIGDPSLREGAARIGLGHAFHRAQSERQYVSHVLALLDDASWTPGWSTDDGPVDDPARRL